MYNEDQLVPLSALQHLLFCERQCALIHLEQAWEENRWTAEGRVMHERVHAEGDESRGALRIVRGVRLRSLRLGLVGQADVVEFRLVDEPPTGGAVRLPKVAGWWSPMPVEYKRGRPKVHDADRVQLCAQAICLEEMLSVAMPAGCLFYGEPRRREEVEFSVVLRTLTEDTARRVHELLDAGATPMAIDDPRCRLCSLRDMCHPDTCGQGKSVERYIRRMLTP